MEAGFGVSPDTAPDIGQELLSNLDGLGKDAVEPNKNKLMSGALEQYHWEVELKMQLIKHAL